MWFAWVFALLAILTVVISVSLAMRTRNKNENVSATDAVPVYETIRGGKQKQKFIYHKGIEGFGDRLQALLEVIETAEKTKRIVVVDWEDPHWCHDTRYAFDYFFKITGVKYMTKKDFIQFATKSKLTFYPKYWTARKLEKDVGRQGSKERRKARFDLKGSGDDYDNKWKNMVLDPKNESIDCWVNASNLIRSWGKTGYRKLKFRPAVKEYFKAEKERMGLGDQPYNVVHLRGGDRVQIKDVLPYSDMKGKTKMSKISKEEYVKIMIDKLKSEIGLSPAPLVVLTDDIALYKLWRESYAGKIIHSDAYIYRRNCFDFPKDTKQGSLHLLDSQHLLCEDIQKHHLQLAAMRDFMLIGNATRVVSDGESYFSNMARKCAHHFGRFFGQKK